MSPGAIMYFFTIATVLVGASASTLPRNFVRHHREAPSSFSYLGRVNPSTNELSWPATGVAFSFTGTSATLPLTAMWGSNSIEVVIDNGAPIINNDVSGTNISTGTLASGQHTVQIRKKSEAGMGSLYIGSPTVVGSFNALKLPRKRIEIIGDSISVGYGADGVFPCTNTAALENAELTYGALTAKNLSADYSIVAWSGKGITRNYVTTTVDTSPLMPELWTRYGANDADNSYTFQVPVDIVVINLGTNDFSYVSFDSSGNQFDARPELDATTYTNALVNFTQTVLSKYPSAEVFITSSPMLSDTYPTAEEAQHSKQEACIQDAVAQIGAKAHFVSFPTQDQTNNNIGCDYHPSPLTHQQMAVILTNAITSVIG